MDFTLEMMNRVLKMMDLIDQRLSSAVESACLCAAALENFNGTDVSTRSNPLHNID